MYTGTVLGITFLLLGFVASMVALVLLTSALAPDLTRRCREAFETPGRTTWVSALMTFLAALLVVGASTAVPAVAAILAGGIAFAAMFGVAGLCDLVGRRMPSPVDDERPWKGTLRGALVLHLAFAVPLVGWFGLLPLSLCAGLGALTRALLARRSPAEAPSEFASPADAEVVAG